MAEFLGDLAFMFEVFVLGAGLFVLHLNKKEKSNHLLWAGRLMTVTASLGILCTGFFYMRYFLAGEFNHAYPPMRHGNAAMTSMMQDDSDGNQHMMMSPQMLTNMKSSMASNMTNCMAPMAGMTMDEDKMKSISECMSKAAAEK